MRIKKEFIGEILALIGGIIAIVACFLPWKIYIYHYGDVIVSMGYQFIFIPILLMVFSAVRKSVPQIVVSTFGIIIQLIYYQSESSSIAQYLGSCPEDIYYFPEYGFYLFFIGLVICLFGALIVVTKTHLRPYLKEVSATRKQVIDLSVKITYILSAIGGALIMISAFLPWSYDIYTPTKEIEHTTYLYFLILYGILVIICLVRKKNTTQFFNGIFGILILAYIVKSTLDRIAWQYSHTETIQFPLISFYIFILGVVLITLSGAVAIRRLYSQIKHFPRYQRLQVLSDKCVGYMGLFFILSLIIPLSLDLLNIPWMSVTAHRNYSTVLRGIIFAVFGEILVAFLLGYILACTKTRMKLFTPKSLFNLGLVFGTSGIFLTTYIFISCLTWAHYGLSLPITLYAYSMAHLTIGIFLMTYVKIYPIYNR